MTGPPASDAAALRRMRAQKRADTKPELALRRMLWARGLRYRVHVRLPLIKLRRTADIAFLGPRVAVFVDGCYWHACPVHGTRPKANAHWWTEKLAANVQRDRDTDTRLREIGWESVRIWEHENPSEAVDRIEQIVEARRLRPPTSTS
jgi:DNA mismatch endonuclease, patch repair protein